MAKIDASNLKAYIRCELAEMAKNVAKKAKKNQAKRGNNPFLVFDNAGLNNTMGLGRSLDSQLGTRLQHIAMYLAVEKNGNENVPNIVLLKPNKTGITMETASFPIKQCKTQKIYWGDCDIKDKFTKKCAHYYLKNKDSVEINSYDFNVDGKIKADIEDEINRRDKKNKGIPVDLLYIVSDEKANITVLSYEIKAGGNLDTKNAPSNANEVKSLDRIFGYCNSNARFATCYDGKGNGEPDGSILSTLSRNKILIGKEFWSEILPNGLKYDEFISAYQTSFKKAKVEETISGK